MTDWGPLPYHRDVTAILERENPVAVVALRPTSGTGLDQLLLRQTYRVDATAHPDVHAAVQRAADALGVTVPIEIYVDEGGQGSNAELLYVPDKAVLVLDRRHAQPARRRRAVRGRRARAGPPRAVDRRGRPVPRGGPTAGRRRVGRAHAVGVPGDRPPVPAGHRAVRRPRGRAGVRVADHDGQRPGQGGDGADEGRPRGVPAAGGRGRLQRAERRHHAPRDGAARVGAAGVERARRGGRSRGDGGARARSSTSRRSTCSGQERLAEVTRSLVWLLVADDVVRSDEAVALAQGYGVLVGTQAPALTDMPADLPAGDPHLPRGGAAGLRHGRRRARRRSWRSPAASAWRRTCWS